MEEWASVLKVAHQWEFESIRSLALGQIGPHATPVDLVVLGMRYGMVSWVQAGRVQLCRREEPLTHQEAARMGIEEVTNISATRHHIRPSEVRPEVNDHKIISFLQGDLHNPINTVGQDYKQNPAVMKISLRRCSWIAK